MSSRESLVTAALAAAAVFSACAPAKRAEPPVAASVHVMVVAAK